MEWYLQRWLKDDRGILGHLFLGDSWDCFTLEDPLDYIPEGRYKLSVYASPRFRRNVLLLHEVPGRSYIEIHVGNTVADTEGCILVGQSLRRPTHSDDLFVASSVLALNRLLRVFRDPCWLNVTKEARWTD